MLDSSASDAAVTTGATAAGMVFTWGDNRYKQLGISGLHAAADAVAPPSSPSTVATPSHTDIPQLVVSLRSAGVDVREVHCGWRHTLFLCAEGRVFSCGDNAHGQGGVGDFAPRATPALITLTPTDGDLGGPSTDRDTAGHAPPLLCAAVAAGWKHSLLLCRDRKRLFAAGSNAFGQLGSLPVDIAAAAVRSVQGDVAPAAAVRAPSRKSAALKVCVPRLVQFPSTVDPESFSIAQIAAGWSHSLVRSTDHRLFGWGRADMGQLSVAPAAIAANAAASSSSLSSSSSSAAAAVATAASLASIDLSKCIPLPMELSLPARERLCPSCSQSSSCSSSTAAAAAPGPSTPVQAEANSNREPMRWIACGSEHSLVVTPHDVFLCGWNEHGNLGQGHARPLEDSFGFSHVAQLHLCTRHNTSVAEHMAPPAATQGSFDSSDANAIASSSAKQFCDGSDSVHLPPIRAVATGGAAVILLH
jgi:alpha-tubulin suppressor-like RCC1 family protein